MAYWTANEILTQVGVEVGLDFTNDPFASSDKAYVQLRYLMDAAGKELLRMYPWKDLAKKYDISTPSPMGDGVYDLPPDFAYMIPQTNWNKTDQVPVFGPISPQDWSYLEGRGLVSSTIYISFRLQNRKFRVFPNDQEIAGKDIFFEYISDWWVDRQDGTFTDRVIEGTDIVIYPAILMTKFVKTKFLEAKGFDSTKARDDFVEMLDSITGQDKSAPVLNAGGWGRTFPYLDSWYNLPDSGYGRF